MNNSVNDVANNIEPVSIIIAGGGPTGLATALFLAQRAPELAAQTLILEAQEYPRPKLCGGGITVHGDEILAALGLELTVKAFEVHRLEFRLGRQHFAVDHPRAMRVVDRAEFDAALADAVRARGIRLHTGERILEALPRNGGVEVVTNRARYHTRVLVAADGANSTVRRKLGIPSAAGIARLLRVLHAIEPEYTPIWRQHTAVFDFTCVRHGIQGYYWDFPCYSPNGSWPGKACMNRGIFDSRIAPLPAAIDPARKGQLKQTFAQMLNARGLDLEQLDLQGHPVRWFNPEAVFSRPHVLLAGDAAGVDPLFAEGISYGMQYGEIVTTALQDAFARGDFLFSDYRARLMQHSLGRLLHRRTIVARHLYQHKQPALWSLLWRCASIAPRPVQRRIGAYLALLPAQKADGIAFGSA